MVQKTIDMKFMRYINLFEQVSHVPTTNCFVYNNSIIFAVPRNAISKAIGKKGVNVRRMNEILRRRIKIIAMPNSPQDMERFVIDLIDPAEISRVELQQDGNVIISGNRQNKAILIGRDRTREKELEDILKKFFEIQKLRII